MIQLKKLNTDSIHQFELILNFLCSYKWSTYTDERINVIITAYTELLKIFDLSYLKISQY